MMSVIALLMFHRFIWGALSLQLICELYMYYARSVYLTVIVAGYGKDFWIFLLLVLTLGTRSRAPPWQSLRWRGDISLGSKCRRCLGRQLHLLSCAATCSPMAHHLILWSSLIALAANASVTSDSRLVHLQGAFPNYYHFIFFYFLTSNLTARLI